MKAGRDLFFFLTFSINRILVILRIKFKTFGFRILILIVLKTRIVVSKPLINRTITVCFVNFIYLICFENYLFRFKKIWFLREFNIFSIRLR